ncbi:FAD-dependent oxidoreductase [Paracidovorax citrulli]|uniref:FAD-dependent oxidoreductase n=1 Tax=Paracidovorax citrulli TaxID=80869 RepID=UPI00031E7426
MDYDLVVIGAGPAGMAAATKGAGLGLKVLLLDEQAQAGGQIYRRVQEAGPQALRILGSDYAAGRELVERLQASGADTCSVRSWSMCRRSWRCSSVSEEASGRCARGI